VTPSWQDHSRTWKQGPKGMSNKPVVEEKGGEQRSGVGGDFGVSRKERYTWGFESGEL